MQNAISSLCREGERLVVMSTEDMIELLTRLHKEFGGDLDRMADSLTNENAQVTVEGILELLDHLDLPLIVQ